MGLEVAERDKKNLFNWFKKRKDIKISDYVDTIEFLEAPSRNEALKTLVDSLSIISVFSEKDRFYKAILEREKIVSTGIGLGCAIPHAKIDGIDKFFISIGIQKKKALNWDAIDKLPVRIVFMIGGPKDRQKEYLQILSHLTIIIKNSDVRKRLLQSKTKEEVLKLISSF